MTSQLRLFTLASLLLLGYSDVISKYRHWEYPDVRIPHYNAAGARDGASHGRNTVRSPELHARRSTHARMDHLKDGKTGYRAPAGLQGSLLDESYLKIATPAAPLSYLRAPGPQYSISECNINISTTLLRTSPCGCKVYVVHGRPLQARPPAVPPTRRVF